MTPEAQRIAIAEACGWRWTDVGNGQRLLKLPANWNVSLPDYLNDLNAMHKAEKILTEDQKFDFICSLIKVMDTALPLVVFATATQRAEAF